jgi:ribosomal protein S18 acetylase RimI-like enzyme
VTYLTTHRVPTPVEHRELADVVGWAGSFRWDAMPASLAGSVCGVVVHDASGGLVTMGRVVGDGAFFFYVQDVAVHPDHRSRGLGRMVVQSLQQQIGERAAGEAFVGLFSTPEAVNLYDGQGFRSADGMTGMWQVLRP